MQRIARRFAPLGVMIALVAWCCWSQLSDGKPLFASTNDEKLPQIQRKSLRPEISSTSERDPFLQFKPEPPAEAEVAASKPVMPETPPLDIVAVRRSLQLDATILGGNRLAVINGQVCQVGQEIALESFPGLKLEVQQIHALGVVLQVEGKSIELHSGAASPDEPQKKPLPAMIEALPSLEQIGELLNRSFEADQVQVDTTQIEEDDADDDR